MTNDIPFLIVKFEGYSACLEAAEPDDFFFEMRGKIVTVGESDEETLVGKFCIYYADVDSAYDEGLEPLEVLDTFFNTVDYFSSIYVTNGTDFNEKLLHLLNYDAIGNNCLILDRLELLPRYRGRNLGLIILRRLIQRFSLGAGVVAIKPFPLQFEHEPSTEKGDHWRNELQLTNFTKIEHAATQKLRSYYRKLGFIGMRGTPFMFRSTALRLPTVEELST
jgi:GNAT superfamily N-acetyltransferase